MPMWKKKTKAIIEHPLLYVKHRLGTLYTLSYLIFKTTLLKCKDYYANNKNEKSESEINWLVLSDHIVNKW